MTFSIVGRCARTGQLGIAISSSSIAVGARCPWVRTGVGAVASQNVTLPALGARVLDRLQQGSSAKTAIEQAVATDKWPQYRQVTVVDANGGTAFFSGEQSLGLNTAVAGDQCVAAGNMLASLDVIACMPPAFENAEGPLATRLLAAMRAALAAGGEAGPVHSAALKVHGELEWPLVDLRVDWADEDPIGVLERLWKDYEPQMQAYVDRALDPSAAPSYGVPGDE